MFIATRNSAVSNNMSCGRAQPASQRAHSTPDPESPPSEPTPSPVPDDVPGPTHAPVEEPTRPEPPIRAR